MSTLGIIKITEPERLDTVKAVILEHRSKHSSKSSYELYGIDYNNGRLKVTRVDHAPTSGDFAPIATKKRIACLIETFNMAAEFRGAWKSDDEAKVVAYESTQQADINAAK
jgi:hypothetical protein